MLQKPRAGQIGDPFKRPSLLEQVRRTGNDLNLHDAAHKARRMPVELDYRKIAPTYDQKCRGLHLG